jgi:hypothetical protein
MAMGRAWNISYNAKELISRRHFTSFLELAIRISLTARAGLRRFTGIHKVSQAVEPSICHDAGSVGDRSRA